MGQGLAWAPLKLQLSANKLQLLVGLALTGVYNRPDVAEIVARELTLPHQVASTRCVSIQTGETDDASGLAASDAGVSNKICPPLKFCTLPLDQTRGNVA